MKCRIDKWIISAWLLALLCLYSPARAGDGYFPILPWELPPRANFQSADVGLGSLADCGFNTAAFVLPEDLEQCAKLKLHALLRHDPALVPWASLSDEQIIQRVEKIVAGTQGDPTVLGYFLEDEPNAREFPALGKAVLEIKRLAPGKLAYINLFPDYAIPGTDNLSQLGAASYADYLKQYVEQVKPPFVSYDDYRVQYSVDLKNSAMAVSYFRNLLAVRQIAMSHGLPFWAIVSSTQIIPEAAPPSPADTLLQAYASLAAGARGLTWYTYYAGPYEYAPVNQAGHRTATWSYLRMVNEQVRALSATLLTLQSTGVYFSGVAGGSDLPALPGSIVRNVSASAPMMVGEFAGPGDKKYVMVVNLSLHDSAKIKINLHQPGSALSLASPVDGSFSVLKGDSFWLAAGQGALLEVGSDQH